MTSKNTRRGFLKTAGLAAGVATLSPVPTIARGRLEKPTLLGIGAGGKGRADLEGARKAGFDVIALADVVDIKAFNGPADKRTKGLGQVRTAFPDAVFGTDYREMLSELGDKVDAVTVSTPDHHHFHASVQAMLGGKHVYCQKPLTHGIWEARMMKEVAEKTGVKTQMGNQAHANDHMRRCIELLRAGVIGKVTEIHTWTNRPIWPQGFAKPPAPEPVPKGLDWRQWIGPAPWVEYNRVIAPFAWRGWWNYGTGALGDMACHIMDLGFWSMKPGAPTSVIAEQNGATDYSPPINSNITWEFAANDFSSKDGFTINWYDGYVDASFNREKWTLDKASKEYNHPSEEVLEGMDFNQFGSVIIGENGKLFFNRGRDNWVLKTNSGIDGFEWPAESVPRATNQDNYVEWYEAVMGNISQGESNFGLAGPFTETILLGVLAQRVAGEKLVWDAENMKVTGRADLDPYIHREYSDGWSEKLLLG
ncbi:MAG: Gfo/Idh/MocA family oxidoreductase [Planctomycetota bacterium]